MREWYLDQSVSSSDKDVFFETISVSSWCALVDSKVIMPLHTSVHFFSILLFFHSSILILNYCLVVQFLCPFFPCGKSD